MSPAYEPERPHDAVADTTFSAFVPIVIFGLVMVAWFAFQAVQMRMERDAMRDSARPKSLAFVSAADFGLNAIAHP